MSLQIWLPLNGSLTNQGLTGTDGIATNATIDNSGKLGKCYSFAGRGYITVNNPETIPTLNFSISVWALFNDETSTMGLCTCRTATGKGIALFKIGNGLRFDVSTTGTQINSMITANQWYHIAATYDGSKTRLYVNGELKQELSKSLSSIGNISSIGWCIGASSESLNGNGNYLQGKMNDFRTYNHCLSTKEIKEISQGLFCHYKMNNVSEISTATNLYQDTRTGYFAESSFTRTAKYNDTDGNYYNYTKTYTGTGTNAWMCVRMPKFNFTAGKRYFYTCEVRVNSVAASSGISVRAARLVNDYMGCPTYSLNAKTNGWVRVVLNQVLNSTFTYSGATKTTSPCLEFYTGSWVNSGQVYSIDFDVRNVAIYQSDIDLGYIDNTLNSGGVIEDCSGWGNNGTNVNITSLGAGNKYNKSLVFFKGADNASSTQIKVPRACKLTDQITVACWAYKDTWTADDWRLFSCTESGGWNIQHSTDGGTSCYATCYANGSYRQSQSYTLTSGWHHFAFTWDGFKTNLFVDGVEMGNKTAALTTRTPITYHASNGICLGCEVGGGTSSAGSHFVGRINDFRIYATALSADDVKALYSVRTAIDNKANIYSGELIEKDGNSGFEKNFTAHTPQFDEISKDFNILYDNNVYIEPDGSKWVRVFHHNNPTTSGPFASADTFTTSVYKDANRWFNVSICNYINRYELMVKQTDTSGGSVKKYRWVQTTNPMGGTYEDVVTAKVTKVTTSGYSTHSSYGGIYHIGSSSTYLCAANASKGNWFGAIGMLSANYPSTGNKNIPGYAGVNISTGYIDLYVRVDNINITPYDVAGIGKLGYVKSKSFIEN